MTDSHSTEGSVALEEPRLGTLILIGGNEDCLTTKDVLREVAEAAGGADGILVMITTASNEPEDRMVVYRKAFEDLGVGTIHIINPDKRVDGSDPHYLEMIASATGVMFTGGDQLRITSLLGGTPLIAMIQMRYREEGLLVAGTSAGASALSCVMIYEGDGETGLEKNSVQTTSGIGLLRAELNARVAVVRRELHVHRQIKILHHHIRPNEFILWHVHRRVPDDCAVLHRPIFHLRSRPTLEVFAIEKTLIHSLRRAGIERQHQNA